MVEATHSLAGLIGSMHCLITLHTRPWNRTQARRHTFNQHGCHGSGKFMLLQHKILISNIKTKRLFHQFLEREKRKLQEAGLDWKGKHISICLFDLAWRLRSLLIKELIRIRAVLLLQHTQLMCLSLSLVGWRLLFLSFQQAFHMMARQEHYITSPLTLDSSWATQGYRVINMQLFIPRAAWGLREFPENPPLSRNSRTWYDKANWHMDRHRCWLMGC